MILSLAATHCVIDKIEANHKSQLRGSMEFNKYLLESHSSRTPQLHFQGRTAEESRMI